MESRNTFSFSGGGAKIVVALLIVFVFGCGAAFAVSLENESLRRVVETDKGLRTTQFASISTGESIDVVSAEFRLLLDGGEELRASSFEIVSSEETPSLRRYTLKNATKNIEISISYEARPGEAWTRKRMKVSGGHGIKTVEVERFRIAGDEKGEKRKITGGGNGPLYIGGMFVSGVGGAQSVESKEGLNVVSYQYGGADEEYASVIGFSSDASEKGAESAFRAYTKSSCGGPAGIRTVITARNSGAAPDDSGRMFYENAMKKLGGTEYGPYAVLAARETLGNAALDAKKYLNAEIAVVLNSGVPVNDVSKADTAMAGAACPAVFSRRHEALNRMIEMSGKAHPREIIVRKAADCAGTGQGADRTLLSSNERDFVSEIRRIEPCAAVFGDYLPYIESQTYYDALIIPDPENALLPPATHERLLSVTARDAAIYAAVKSNPQLSPAEIFGFNADVNGLNEIRGGDGAEWIADELLMRYLSGGANALLNIDFDSLSADDLKIVNAILRWAKKNGETLAAKNVFLGPNPLDGEPYAYAHVNGARAIVGVRNPAFLPSEFSLKIDGASGFSNANIEYEARISYPYEASLGSKFKYGDEISLSIEREQIVIIDIAERGHGDFDAPADVSYPPSRMAGAQQLRRDKSAAGVEGVYMFTAPAGLKTELIVYAETPDIDSNNSVELTVIVNGEPAKTRTLKSFGLAEGEQKPSGWVMHRIQLAPGTSRVGFAANAPGAALWSWLMTRGEPAAGVPLFSSGLPADRSTSTTSEIKLF